jgi:hypothetical protein
MIKQIKLQKVLKIKAMDRIRKLNRIRERKIENLRIKDRNREKIEWRK